MDDVIYLVVESIIPVFLGIGTVKNIYCLETVLNLSDVLLLRIMRSFGV